MNIFQRFLSWIVSLFKKTEYKEPKREVVEERRKYQGYCEFCNVKKGFPDYFYCKYCQKYHCDKHRLPEQHDCLGKPTLPEDMK
jgi:predicted nucleic acid binding AN1-type Zn finger protein